MEVKSRLEEGMEEYTVYKRRRVRPSRAMLLPMMGLVLLVYYHYGSSWTLLALFLSLLLSFLVDRHTVSSESIMIIEDMGVQLTTSYIYGSPHRTFIPKSEIQDIIINEGITMCKIIFYLSFVLDGSNHMTIGFKNTQPPLRILREVYIAALRLLMEYKEEPLVNPSFGSSLSPKVIYKKPLTSFRYLAPTPARKKVSSRRASSRSNEDLGRPFDMISTNASRTPLLRRLRRNNNAKASPPLAP